MGDGCQHTERAGRIRDAGPYASSKRTREPETSEVTREENERRGSEHEKTEEVLGDR